MHPGIVFFLLPVMCAICLVIIAPLHFFGATFFAYENWRQWATAGFLYSSLFVFFVFPWAVILVVLVNPITMRFIERCRAA
jgi:uncharacterized membrane protein